MCWDRAEPIDPEEPMLVRWNRGGVSLSDAPLHVCARCFVQTEKTFLASSGTHLIERDPPAEIGLCVKCWGALQRN